MRERLASLGGVALRLGGLALIAILWQVVASLSATPWFPPLSSVLDRSVQLIATGQLLPSLGSSFTNLAIGYAISAAVGLTLGTAMALSTKIDYALRTYVDALLFVPPVVFAPVFFAFFGLSSWTLVFVVVVFAVFVIIVNT
ncbi:MAG TPA: hypothetical protein VFW86_04025, partial [Candidatus Limnocylindrales bacterium]|nr:hypothetical protein [Candidatus Limnocylindrales bacterium]